MPSPPAPIRPLWPRLLAATAAVVAATFGGLVIVSWLSDQPWLQGPTPSGITMKFNTAVALVCCGLSLLLIAVPESGPSRPLAIIASVPAAVALLIGSITLAEHLTGWNPGLDGLFFAEPPGERATISPGRMGPPAATSFTVLGVALLLLCSRKRALWALAQLLALVVSALACLSLVGYLYGADQLFGVARYSGIAATTAAALFALGIGTVVVRPDRGPAAILAADDAGGLLARRLLPILITLPVMLGWIRLQLEGLYYDTRFGASILVVILIVLLVSITWSVAARLGRRDRQNRDLTGSLETANAQLADERGRLEEAVRARTRQLEASHERLRQSERAAALGAITAGLGHDVSNLLLPIRIRVEALRAEPLSESARQDVESIGAAADYLQRLANSLRLLTRNRDEPLPAIDSTRLRDWWTETVPLLRAVLPGSVSIEHEFAPGLQPVAMPRDQLTQVVFNLVSNAGEVLKGQPRGTVRIHAAPGPSRFVRLTVTDDGPGMTDEVRRRCFEPYFSTKRKSFATGMGLAMVRSIVEGAGGKLDLRTAPGEGASFIIDLPVGAPGRTPSKAPADASRPARALVIVPDARRRAFITELLRSLRIESTAIHAPIPGPIAAEAEAEILILEASDDTAAAMARRFLHLGRGDRQIVWIGKAPPAAVFNGEAPRLIHAGDTFDPASVRSAVQRAVTIARGETAPPAAAPPR